MRSVLGFASGVVLSSLLGLAIVPYIAWNFAPADVARLNLFQVSVTFGMLLCSFGLDQTYVREYQGVKNKVELFSSCFLPGVLAIGVIGVPITFFGEHVSKLLFDYANSSVGLGLTLAVLASYIVRYVSLVFRMRGDGWLFSFSQVGSKLIQLSCVVVVVLMLKGLNFAALFWASVVSLIISAVLFSFFIKEHWRSLGEFKLASAVDGLAYGLPLVFSGLIYWLLAASTVISFRYFDDMNALALFSVVSSFAASVNIVQSIFTLMWQPFFFKWLDGGLQIDDFNDVVSSLALVVGLIYILIGCFSWLLGFILPAEYGVAKYYLIAAVVPPLFYTLSEATCVGIAVSRKTKLNVLIGVAAVLVAIVVQYSLVPVFGVKGGLLAGVLSYYVFLILRTELAVWVWTSFKRRVVYYISTSIVVASVLAIFCAEKMGELYFTLIWFVVLSLYIAIFGRRIYKMRAKHWDGRHQARGVS